MKRCPLCAEKVQAKAIKCKYCGSSLSDQTSGPLQEGPEGRRQQKESKSVGWLTLIIVAAVMFLFFRHEWRKLNPTPGDLRRQQNMNASGGNRRPSTVELNAAIRFTGTQFTVQNKDTFEWTNVKFEVNAKAFSSGYILKVARMAAGETCTVGTMQFAKADGERFDPFTHKPLRFDIWCDTPQGDGVYFGGWE